MEINLRKAHAIQAVILDTVEACKEEMIPILNLTIDEDPLQKREEALEEFLTNQSRIEKLLDALLYIRTEVSKKNHELGINELLAKKSILDKIDSSYDWVYKERDGVKRFRRYEISEEKLSPYWDADVIKKRLARLEDSMKKSTGIVDSTIKSWIMTKQQVIDAELTCDRLDKEARELIDRTTQLNIMNTIPLPEPHLSVLTSENIL